MVDLSSFNTLRIPAKADKLIELNSESEINQLPPENNFFLGDGANVLFKGNLPGVVTKINLKGREVIKETDNFVEVRLGAGENWHETVSWTVANNLSGMENMALIPGTVGAAAIGNIAAYGQNQEDIFVELQATNLKSQKKEVYANNDMQFGYRESAFKKSLAEYLVTSVTYRLSKTAHLELSYHATRHASLLPTLQSLARPPFAIKDIYSAVIKLRTEKLPDPKVLGTAGSFFKNPIIPKSQFYKLKSQIPSLQCYPPEKLKYTDESAWLEKVDRVKVAGGRLLDELGWKGKRIGNVGTYHTHALTLVTYPGATGAEVFEFAESMRADIQKNFNITLEYEVVIV